MTFRRFHWWSKKGILAHLFKVLTYFADIELVLIDGSIVQLLWMMKVLLKVEVFNLNLFSSEMWRITYLELSEDQEHDIIHTQKLIEHLKQIDILIADKGYDSNFCQVIGAQGGTLIIQKFHGINMFQEWVYWYLYKHWHLVDNYFWIFKCCRIISESYDKARSCTSMVSLALTLMGFPMYLLLIFTQQKSIDLLNNSCLNLAMCS